MLVSLLGLRLSGLATFAAFGFATAITVVAVMVTALMLVPAVFAVTRRWIEPRAVRRAGKGKRVRPAAIARADRPSEPVPSAGRAGSPAGRCRG